MKKIIAIICLILALLCFTSCADEYPSWKNPDENNKTYDDEGFFENPIKNKETKAPKPVIYFETNGGNKISPIQMTSEGVTLPNPTKEDHTFEGWYLNPELTHQPTYPFRPTEDITLYAKWIKTTVRQYYNGSELKMWFEESSGVKYFITPNGLDLDTLQANGYKIKVTVTYDVRYVKTYDVPFDIGYAGSPKYETLLKIENTLETSQNDLGTSKAGDSRTITYTTSAANFNNNTITLTFSTDNIQNTIYFENIVVTYQCYK